MSRFDQVTEDGILLGIQITWGNASSSGLYSAWMMTYYAIGIHIELHETIEPLREEFVSDLRMLQQVIFYHASKINCTSLFVSPHVNNRKN